MYIITINCLRYLEVQKSWFGVAAILKSKMAVVSVILVAQSLPQHNIRHKNRFHILEKSREIVTHVLVAAN